jgi:excisionase family DNA binding protein
MTMTPVNGGYLTTADAARYAATCDETIRRAIRSKQLRAVRIGRVWRTRTEWIDQWIFAEVGGPPDCRDDAIIAAQPGTTRVT